MPVDAATVADGNITIAQPAGGAIVDPIIDIHGVLNPPPVGAPRFTSHFVTCPDAREHRRPR